MARANRHYIKNCIWHITHRCHKREFLLKFRKDKKNWMSWLFEAKKRYGLCILNFAVTSNHIHLLVVDTQKNVLPKSIQLLAGRTGREYNIRMKRKGAFWEDRYHATAVQDGLHLVKCLIYIDMNMVRTGVVKHPSEWNFCGYNEILDPPKRYTLIDNNRLMSLCGYSDNQKFQADYKSLIDDEINKDNLKRKYYWTESIAVGTKDFIVDMKISLGALARGRKISSDDKRHMIQESLSPYNAVFDTQKCNPRKDNRYFWTTFPENSDS